MANLQYTENMTSEQVDAMSGSETLRYQVTLFGITRNNKALSKSTNRLRDSLLPREEPKLAIPLLLLIAQHRSMIVTNADAPYIKMVSEQFDRCHGTLLQYVEFLSSAITPSTAYAQLIPNLDDLVHKYHLDPEVAFLIYRPLMRLFKCSDGPEVFWPGEIFEESNTSNADNESETLSSSNNFVLDLASIKKHVTWPDLLDTVRSMLPTKAWNSLSPDLYATFWGLTLYDLYVPRKRYESEISKQHTAIKALEELSDNSNSAITKRKKDKEKIQELLDRLVGEYENHEQHVTSVHRRLSREKDRWWSSCPDTSKINMEFLQRCIYPRCIFSVPDAVYCAKFVNTLHSLGTPFFNTVNHIDVLICKTLQPMICSCTEFEAGRLGRFLYETLKMAYHWKSDESVYERECGNKPGFAVYYRFPNSQRVTFGQFVRVHWKWSGRITRLLVQCLESSEYMEIRNALIILTKISSVFPVTRKTGINLEKRVAKIKGDEREDLKVLATGVAAALASRKSSWVSDEEFGMGYLDLKPTVAPVKSLPGNLGSTPNGSALVVSQSETGARNSSIGSQAVDNPNMTKDQITHTKASDGRLDRPDSASLMKPDLPQQKTRAGSSLNGLQDQSTMTSSGVPPKTLGVLKSPDELSKSASEVTSKGALESETRPQLKRTIQTIGKPPKQDVNKDETRPGKSISRAASQPSSTAVTDKDFSAHQSEGRQGGSGLSSSTHNGSVISSSVKVLTSSSRVMDSVGIRHSDDSVEVPEVSRTISARSSHSPLPGDSFTKQPRRNSPSEEHDRLGKRRKVDTDGKDSDGLEVRTLDKDRNVESRPMDKTLVPDHDRTENEEPNINKPTEKYLEKSRDRSIDRHDKDHKEKLDRPERIRAEDILEKARDRSMERHGRERSVDRIADRGADRSIDKSRDERNKEERNKTRHSEGSMEKSHVDERFHGQSLPPPPPLPPSYVPQSVGGSRRDEEVDRRAGSSRHMQRLSPRHDEKERRRSEEIVLASHDDAKRRREDEFRERKRDDRDGGISTKAEERDRDKGNALKDDMDSGTTSKRRKIKRDHASTSEASGEYSPAVPPPPPLTGGISQSFEARERSDRKGGMMQHRAAYMDEQAPRLHGKESLSKINRREAEQIHEREWEEEKRLRAEAKRKHRK